MSGAAAGFTDRSGPGHLRALERAADATRPNAGPARSGVRPRYAGSEAPQVPVQGRGVGGRARRGGRVQRRLAEETSPELRTPAPSSGRCSGTPRQSLRSAASKRSTADSICLLKKSKYRWRMPIDPRSAVVGVTARSKRASPSW
ncbi:hypothetical protein GCM10028833_32760 [Glycomyces tarimensis]